MCILVSIGYYKRLITYLVKADVMKWFILVVIVGTVSEFMSRN